MRWPSFGKLWAQIARATMRQRAATHFPLKATLDGATVTVAVDAIGADEHDNDRFLTGLDGRLEITSRPEVRTSVHAIAAVFAEGLARIQADNPDWFVGIRQNGVVIGLEFDHPDGAKFVMRELYENGVWAIFSTLDPRVLQFKPGLLLSRELCDDVLDRLDVAVAKAQSAARSACK